MRNLILLTHRVLNSVTNSLVLSVQKQVKKVVRLRPTDIEGLYNFVLLDILPDGTTSDTAETNNQDMLVVLATVTQIAVDFLSKNPGCAIAVQGGDAKRQRLYQIMISRELDQIRQQFNVLGGNGNQG